MTSGTFFWSSRTPLADATFIQLAMRWIGDVEPNFVDHIWAGFERLKETEAPFDPRDLERSITQLLEAAIDDVVPGEAPYYVQHGPYERETMLPPPAQPPTYDLAFAMRGDPRIMWPAEAKVLTSSKALAEYIADVREQYLTCRYAPFSASGAMLGYLLDGVADEALANIAQRLAVTFTETTSLDPSRPHRSSIHDRTVPSGKDYPTPFRCHHIILGFHGLERLHQSGEPVKSFAHVDRRRRHRTRTPSGTGIIDARLRKARGVTRLRLCRVEAERSSIDQLCRGPPAE